MKTTQIKEIFFQIHQNPYLKISIIAQKHP